MRRRAFFGLFAAALASFGFTRKLAGSSDTLPPEPLCLWCEDEGFRDLTDGRRISPCGACGQSPPETAYQKQLRYQHSKWIGEMQREMGDRLYGFTP